MSNICIEYTHVLFPMKRLSDGNFISYVALKKFNLIYFIFISFRLHFIETSKKHEGTLLNQSRFNNTRQYVSKYFIIVTMRVFIVRTMKNVCSLTMFHQWKLLTQREQEYTYCERVNNSFFFILTCSFSEATLTFSFHILCSSI